ncbi:hypothetical protein [Saccharibacillus deserti]|uniref:hypothetical protein n=1 Tax=Saccharibacillus deserti TaxID=1634444 RepID=UPI00155777DA|nr:hypothetical protein [Saccharibacillus deserti]
MKKRKIALALLAVAGITGSALEERGEAREIGKAVNGNEQTQRLQLAIKSKAALKLDKNFGKFFVKGKVPGLGVYLGMPEAQVKTLYGKKVDRFYDMGGEFYQYEKLDHVYFCYSYSKNGPILSTIYVQTPPVQNLKASQVKKILGNKGVTYFDDAVGSYMLAYEYEEYHLSFELDSPAGNVFLVKMQRKYE